MLKEASTVCNDKELDLEIQKARIFDIAVRFDQVNVIISPDKNALESRSEVLQKITYEVDNLLMKADDKDKAELFALKGILEDLNDHPQEAINQYQAAIKRDKNYASVYNYWGYTVLKWKLTGSAWSDKALELFAEALKRNDAYTWPRINTAVVWLRKTQEALDSAQTQAENPEASPEIKLSKLADAKAYLDKTNESLKDLAGLLQGNPIEGDSLQHNPRVHLLWGHYHLYNGFYYRLRELPEESDKSFYNAIEEYKKATNGFTNNADAFYVLGQAYEAMGKYQEQALTNYREAASRDRWNIDACIKLADFLLTLGKKENTSKARNKKWDEALAEVDRGLSIVGQLRENFRQRRDNAPDTEKDAKVWLSTRYQETFDMEEYLNSIKQEIKEQNSK